MKRFLTVFLMLLITLSVGIVSFAEHPSRLVDDGDLFTDSEEAELLEMLDSVSEKYDFDVAVLTLSSLGGKSRIAYADDYYDYNGYGMGPNKDGLILLICPNEDVRYVSTCGSGIRIINQNALDRISSKTRHIYNRGDYAGYVEKFIKTTDSILKDYENGKECKPPIPWSKNILISLVIGVIISFIIVFVFKSQMKSVRPNAYANNYVIDGSLILTDSQDRFLYSSVTKTPIPKDNDSSSGGGSHSHTSSSGSSHGGGDI